MRSVRIAEWILALSMTRERAEAVTGDLREAGRGALWFWRSVFTTTIASVWADVLAAPWRLSISVLLLSFLFGGILLIAEFTILNFTLRRSIEIYHRVNVALSVAVTLASSRWIAQCCRGREMASWFVGFLLSIVGEIITLHFLSSNFHWDPWASCGGFALSLLGAISARVRPRLLSSN